MGEDQSGTGQRRVTVAEAAEPLGLTVEAVRGRIKRGKLEHAKDDGTVYVLLDADQSATGPTGQQPVDDQPSDRLIAQTELIEELRDQVSYMREQLAEEREARRRADTILAQLAQANSEQARTIRELEAPAAPEPREFPQTAAGEPEGAPRERPFTEEAWETAGRRPERRLASWWRRWFGVE